MSRSISAASFTVQGRTASPRPFASFTSAWVRSRKFGDQIGAPADPRGPAAAAAATIFGTEP